MRFRTVICLIALTTVTLLPQSVDFIIVKGPSDTTAMVNESTYFNCSTSMSPVSERSIIWFHFPLDGGGQRNYVYDDGRIMTSYKDRFDIDIDLSSVSLNLLLLRLKPSDAGRYECRDDALEGVGASAELTVLNSDLSCESDLNRGGAIGPTQCEEAIAPDELQLSCRVTYNGQNAPQLVWKRAGDSTTLNKTICLTKVNRVTCNISVTANLQLNKSIYYCQSTNQKYNCSLELKNVLYAFANTTKLEYRIGDEVTCIANTSTELPCSYGWHKDNSTAAYSLHQAFRSNDSGLYSCQAHCTIRNNSCKFTAMVIHVSTVADSDQNLLHCLWFLLLILAIIVIMMILYRRRWLRRTWCWRNKKIKRRPSEEIEDSQEDLPFKKEEEETKAISSLATLTLDQLKVPNKITANAAELIDVDEPTKESNLNEETNKKEPTDETVARETNAERITDSTNEVTNNNIEKTQGNEIIERHRAFLEERMDPDFGLLEELMANRTLCRKEILEIRSKIFSYYKRNSQLLDYILEKNEYSGLISALRASQQVHIVNYLDANEEYDGKYGEEWPLTVKEILTIDTNQNTMIELLNLSDVLGRLRSSNVINKRQEASISSESTPFKKTEVLLEILRRRSLCDYRNTISCLENSNQNRIAELLKSGGVVTKVHINLDGPLEDVTRTEDEISTTIASALNGTSIAERMRILKLAEFKLIAAAKGQSIVFYIWCETAEELSRLQKYLISGRLKDSVERLFNQQLTLSKEVVVNSVKMNEEEFERMKTYFTAFSMAQLEESDASAAVQGLNLPEGKLGFASSLKREQKGKQVAGVTVLKNDLFVALENSSVLKVYDVINKFAFKRKVPVPDLVNPSDLACCHKTECVFISDSKLESKQKEIIRIESSLVVYKRWSTDDDFGNLSVSSESNVILCVFYKNKLIEYTRDGEEKLIIHLPDLVHPHHAVKLANGQFVVSHGCNSDALHRVCTINKEGEIIKSFGLEKGASFKQLNEPTYLIVDEEGFILIADSGNRRVLLLDYNLAVKREFRTKYPGKMCRHIETRRSFIVGQDEAFKLLIFGINC